MRVLLCSLRSMIYLAYICHRTLPTPPLNIYCTPLAATTTTASTITGGAIISEPAGYSRPSTDTKHTQAHPSTTQACQAFPCPLFYRIRSSLTSPRQNSGLLLQLHPRLDQEVVRRDLNWAWIQQARTSPWVSASLRGPWLCTYCPRAAHM